MVWIQRVAPRPFAARRLICFPHAGGSPYFFQNWGKALDGFEVHAVCYPGRAERMAEAPAEHLATMARDIAGELAEALAEDERPAVFFGHSMGAIVGYETAVALAAKDAGPAQAHTPSPARAQSHVHAPTPAQAQTPNPAQTRAPTHFFASGARAPHLMRPDPHAYGDDASVAAALVELGGTDAELLANPAFVEFVLPYIGADFRMLSSYSATRAAPLECPVTALVGAADPRVSAEQASAWREVTRGPFALHTPAGDHFYLAQEPPFGLIERCASGC
ncbi:thioesterase II family protein [Streptomyces sp. NPDC048111]|uniref:thioesterase II family protein n=1 Tax=Streptomyces sp. NPDC048111 TaxID=3365500 RepID=UPI0037120367